MPTLIGSLVRLEPATAEHVPALAAIRRTPEVHAFWRGGTDLVAAVIEDLKEPDSTAYVIEFAGRVVGWIQWSEEDDPDYRYASIDIYLDPAVHGRGVEVDVDAGITVIRIVLFRPLDPADHSPGEFDDVRRRVRLLQVLDDSGHQIGAPAPERMDLGCSPDGGQRRDMFCCRGFQADERADQRWHERTL